jgi:hypothetical protein
MTQLRKLVGVQTIWPYFTIAALLLACGNSASITVKLDTVPGTVTYDNLNTEKKLRITGIVTASSPTTVTALSLSEDGENDATASFVLGSATVTGSAPFSLDWAVPLNEAGVTHKLTLLATPAKGGTEIRTPISIIIDTKAPTISSFSAKSSLSVSGRLEVTFAIEGNTKSVALAVDTVEIPLDPGARTHSLTALTPKKRYSLELRIKGTNGAPATATEQAAPGMVFAKSGAPTANASGSFSKPYGTISAALQSLEEATIPFTVAVAAGTYNVASGETFPLSLGSDRSLSGETNANNELVTIIEGVGERSLELEGPTNVCMSILGEHTTGSGNSSIDHVKFNYASASGCDGKTAAVVAYNHSITIEDSEVLNHNVGVALLALTECRSLSLTGNKFRGPSTATEDPMITVVGKGVLTMRGNDVEGQIGVKLDYHKDPAASCDDQPQVLSGNRIKTRLKGFTSADAERVEIGNFNGQRSQFILDSTDGFTESGVRVIDFYGDNAELRICDTDIDVNVGPDGVSSDTIRVENARLRFGDAGNFSSCSSAGATRINISAPTMNGIRIVSGSPSLVGGKIEGKSLALIHTAADVTTYGLRGVAVENSLTSSPPQVPVELNNSTIRGFAHNIHVDNIENPLINLNNVCVNSPDDGGRAWTNESTSQDTYGSSDPTHDPGVPTAARVLVLADLGNSNSDGIANYFIADPGNATIDIKQTATLCFPRPE